MRFFASLAALSTLAIASVLPIQGLEHQLEVRDLLERDPQCTNGPSTRACWNNGFSIATDFDKKHPNTGKMVSYHFTITNGTCNPDGHGERICLLVDGQYPGPPIVADWGDMVSVSFTNLMPDNGTSIHFHGLRQLNSCGADGVPGITQCPIAPGQTYTYLFQATQFGSSWYHSHWSAQYGDGLLGPIVFKGPAAANYDIDLGAYPVSDWYHQPVFGVASIARALAQQFLGAPNASTILINGTNQNPSGTGKYNQVTLTPGKKHLLRIINTSLNNWIRVSLDNHVFQVISSDFVPIKPFNTEYILLGVGQRYDVIINANQTASNYWLRAEVASDCLSRNDFNGLAVFSYSGVKVANPSSTAYPQPPQTCIEPTPIPFWNQPVPSSGFNSVVKTLEVGVTKAVEVPGGPLIFVWSLNGSMDVQWELPTLSYFYNDNTNYTDRSNVFPTLEEGSWNYWIITTGPPPLIPQIPHPIHLHGHDFFVLGQGMGNWDSSSAATLNFQNPTRRDTATIYGGGWLALAWRSDNPGAWIMRKFMTGLTVLQRALLTVFADCHIAFHIGEGLGVQFTESPSKTVLPDETAFNQTCDTWNKYYANAYYKKSDSGL